MTLLEDAPSVYAQYVVYEPTLFEYIKPYSIYQKEHRKYPSFQVWLQNNWPKTKPQYKEVLENDG